MQQLVRKLSNRQEGFLQQRLHRPRVGRRPKGRLVRIRRQRKLRIEPPLDEGHREGRFQQDGVALQIDERPVRDGLLHRVRRKGQHGGAAVEQLALLHVALGAVGRALQYRERIPEAVADE